MATSSPRIFVVDDDPSVRKGLERLLRAGGYETEAFGSAAAYLERAPYEGEGCLILDVSMPGMSGLELQSHLVQSASNLPIVFLTAHGDIPLTVQAMKLGAVDFLTKPVNEAALFDAIAQALARHRVLRGRKQAAREIRAKLDTLSPRQFEVMCLLLSGARNKQIAEKLGISEKTVKVHRAHLMEKLQIKSTAELGRMCSHAGIKPETSA